MNAFTLVPICLHLRGLIVQVNLDMTDSMGPGKLVRHMQNPSYTYDDYLVCIGLGPTIQSVICKNPSYSGLSYPSSPVHSIPTSIADVSDGQSEDQALRHAVLS